MLPTEEGPSFVCEGFSLRPFVHAPPVLYPWAGQARESREDVFKDRGLSGKPSMPLLEVWHLQEDASMDEDEQGGDDEAGAAVPSAAEDAIAGTSEGRHSISQGAREGDAQGAGDADNAGASPSKSRRPYLTEARRAEAAAEQAAARRGSKPGCPNCLFTKLGCYLCRAQVSIL